MRVVLDLAAARRAVAEIAVVADAEHEEDLVLLRHDVVVDQLVQKRVEELFVVQSLGKADLRIARRRLLALVLRIEVEPVGMRRAVLGVVQNLHGVGLIFQRCPRRRLAVARLAQAEFAVDAHAEAVIPALLRRPAERVAPEKRRDVLDVEFEIPRRGRDGVLVLGVVASAHGVFREAVDAEARAGVGHAFYDVRLADALDEIAVEFVLRLRQRHTERTKPDRVAEGDDLLRRIGG